jgi:hypothetical protein
LAVVDRYEFWQSTRLQTINEAAKAASMTFGLDQLATGELQQNHQYKIVDTYF